MFNHRWYKAYPDSETFCIGASPLVAYGFVATNSQLLVFSLCDAVLTFSLHVSIHSQSPTCARMQKASTRLVREKDMEGPIFWRVGYSAFRIQIRYVAGLGAGQDPSQPTFLGQPCLVLVQQFCCNLRKCCTLCGS